MRSSLFALMTVIAVTLASAAISQTSPVANVVQQRQSQFHEIGVAFKAINDELRRENPGRFVLSSSARTIASNLHQVGTMFPVGSGPAPGLKTKAKPAIWSGRAQFDRLNASAVNEANRLVMAMRGTDTNAIRAQIRALGLACQGCHRQFRDED